MSAADGRLDDAITDFSRRLMDVDEAVKTVYGRGIRASRGVDAGDARHQP